MKLLKAITLLATTLFAMHSGLASPRAQVIEDLKNQILTLAKFYEGQGDPDQSKQKKIEVLVKNLINESPMPPISDRLPALAGTWKQVWGPYDYRNNNGGIDPKLGVKEIYQVVSTEGSYYNVAPYYPNGDRSREQIGLLRGEFKLDSADPNGLLVQFTKYPGVEPRPEGINLWELAPLAEADQLENEVTIVPTWIVKLFFGGGKLEEVYTDHDMRILYGSNGKKDARRSIYVMSRVN